MKRIITLTGVTVNNDTLPRVSASDEERTLASVPGLIAWIQAGSKFETESGALRDRASGDFLSPASSNGRFSQASFPNGAAALQFPDPSTRYRGAKSKVPLDRWSVVFVAKNDASGRVSELISAPFAMAPGERSLRLGFESDGGLRCWEGVGQARWTVPDQGWSSEPKLIVVTFSLEYGFQIFVNGVKVAEYTSNKPLTYGDWQIGAQGEGTGVQGTGFHGLLGHLMLFSSDLGAVENTGYRRAIENILMTHYGIS